MSLTPLSAEAGDAVRPCGLLTGPGPACTVCGSPHIDVSVWSTVLHPGGLVVPAMAAVPLSPDTGAPADLGPPSAVWVTLDDAASRSGMAPASLRGWVESRLHEPLPGADPDGAWFLLIERSRLDASGLWLVRDAVAELEEAEAPREPSPLFVHDLWPMERPEPPDPVAPAADRAHRFNLPRPIVPDDPLVSARPDPAGTRHTAPAGPAPSAQPADGEPELGSAWAFLPPAAQLMRERIQRFAVKGAAAVAISGAGEAVYLLLRR